MAEVTRPAPGSGADYERRGLPPVDKVKLEKSMRGIYSALLILEAGVRGAFHASDLLLDRRQLIAARAEAIGRPLPLPAADDGPVSILDCKRLESLGWRPGGWPQLGATLARL